ncbi:uncharacterized protein LOC112575588 [Pomacea canaliculata]|uniref:uncharacterized protein LOC112575588 n=1 Tax=Pomacea canaliculata TaxID=400727 RepID=UPI000D72CC97|nr:uncharacterized protein LOC112575588 [Pomacea canaliculata]
MDREFCLTDREKRKELKEDGEELGLVGDNLVAFIGRELEKWKKYKKEEEDRIKREEAREREYAERDVRRAEREKERERRRAEREKELEEREKELVMREFIEMLEEICEEKGKTEEESRQFIEYNLKGCRWGTIAEEREEKARVKEEERVGRERARERVESKKSEKKKKEQTKLEKEREFLREVRRIGGVSLDDSDPAEAGNYRSERGVVPAGSCSRCGGAGHDPRSCPQQSDRLRRSVGVKCYSCGVVGHYSRSCPRGYELREAVTTRGEKLASEVDASGAYASDRSATEGQVSDVGSGDAVTSGAYTSGRKAADVKVNEVNPSKEEARGVETGEEASGKEGVFQGVETTHEGGGLGDADFPNLLVSQAGHSHAVRQLQVQDQGLWKARELVSGTRALQAAGSGDRERRVPVGSVDQLQAGDSGHREMRAPTVVREPLQTGDIGSLGDQVPTVVREPLQAVDNGHREMRAPIVVREPLQADDTGSLEEQVLAVVREPLQAGDSGHRERRAPTVTKEPLHESDTGDLEEQVPAVREAAQLQVGDSDCPEGLVSAVRGEPLQAGDSGSPEGLVPAVESVLLRAKDDGDPGGREPTVFERPLQAGDSGNLDEQVPAVNEGTLQPGDSGSPEGLVPTVKSVLLRAKDDGDPGGREPTVFEVPLQIGGAIKHGEGVLTIRCVLVITVDGEPGLAVRPAVSPAGRNGEVGATVQTVAVKVSSTPIAECAETARSDRTAEAVGFKKHDEMHLEVQRLEEAIRRSKAAYEEASRLEQAKQRELQDLLRAIADREREREDTRKALNRLRKKIRKERNKLNKLVSNATLGRIRSDLVSKQELDRTSQSRLQHQKEASNMYANEKFGEVQNPIRRLEKKMGESNKKKNEMAKAVSALLEGVQRLHKDSAEVQALLREEQAWHENTLTDIQQQWEPRKQLPRENQERRQAEVEVAAKPRVVQQVTSSVNENSSQLKPTCAMQKLEQNELENLRIQLAEEMGDSERVRVGVKMHDQLKARVESPTCASDGGLAQRPTARSTSQRTQRSKRSRRRGRRRHASSRLGVDRTSRDVNKVGGAASVEIGEALFASGGQGERVQRDQKRVGGTLMRTPRLGPVWERQHVAHGNEQVVNSLRYQKSLHRKVNWLGSCRSRQV